MVEMAEAEEEPQFPVLLFREEREVKETMVEAIIQVE